ncbi:MAG: AraC family transcriptional regulator [Eubacteriales bacterium]
MESWENIQAVKKMQSYIEANIHAPISQKALARVAGYSPAYAARVFKKLTGKTPFEYLRERRLTCAAEKLMENKSRVIDVAFDFVFDSHEGFTRAFSKAFGVPPSQFKHGQNTVKPFMPLPSHVPLPNTSKGDMTMNDKTNPSTVFVQVMERPKRNVILKRGIKAKDYYAYCEEVGCDIWETLLGIKQALYEPIGMWLPEKLILPGTSKYVQGVEVPEDYTGPLPEGYDMITLKPCQMMVFQGEPFDDEAFEQAISDIWALMESYDPTLYGFTWADEDAPRFQMSPQGYRGYIEARPVKRI